MKNLILLLAILSLISCRRGSETRDDKNMNDTVHIDGSLNDEQRMDSINDADSDAMDSHAENTYAEFSVTNGSQVYRLRDWKSKLNLQPLGKANDTLSREMTLTTDTHQGSTILEYKYNDINLDFFRPKGNADSWLTNIEVKGGPWATARGIKVGDSLSDLKNMYPKITEFQDEKKLYSYSYGIDESMMMFGVTLDKVTRIRVQYTLK
ncbi:MAG TPA: hypothetical protein VMZ69_00210 [Saprospiraceae bacterium]|nr:hypothetical protein [Saprospiraceae bacterium]